MDIRKYQFNIFCLLLFPLSATGQEWNKQDSLRLQQMLESDQEIKINRKFIEKVEQNMYSRKPFVDFDPTLPTLKSSMIFSKPSIRTYQTFLKPGSTFLPTYSWLRINKNLVLHSKSNFAEDMRKRSKKCLKMHVECTKRERRMSILLSDEEQLIVDRYLEKYKITNKSRWLRETILMFIHKNMEEDYPTLFGEHDMRR